MGKPRAGYHYDRMAQSRVQFKRSLKLCKENKESIISNKIASNLKGNVKKLWVEINKKRKTHTTLPDVINNTSGSKNIAELWKEHFKSLFNDDTHARSNQIIRQDEDHRVGTSIAEVAEALKYLNSSSSPGHDGLTLHHLTNAHPIITVSLSLFFYLLF